LIAAHAPQKGSSIPRHIQWSSSSIQSILGSAREYAYGFKLQSCAGQTYRIPVLPIIDIPTYELFIKMREENKTHLSQRARHDYLLSGRLKCSCNLTWQARTATKRRSRKGEWVERKTAIGTYFCPQPHTELRPKNCPRSVSAKRAEAQVWAKLCEFVINPVFLLAQAKRLAYQFQQDYGLLQEDLKRIREEQEALARRRNEFITRARIARMNHEELVGKIGIYNEEDVRLKRRLASVEEEINTYANLNFDSRVSAYVSDLQSGLEELNSITPQDPEERHHVFLMKKRMVNMLLEEVLIDGDREIHVTFRTDLVNLLEGDNKASTSNRQVPASLDDGHIIIKL
jgi:hypothetical protein